MWKMSRLTVMVVNNVRNVKTIMLRLHAVAVQKDLIRLERNVYHKVNLDKNFQCNKIIVVMLYNFFLF